LQAPPAPKELITNQSASRVKAFQSEGINPRADEVAARRTPAEANLTKKYPFVR
jgi:hypothetical protein